MFQRIQFILGTAAPCVILLAALSSGAGALAADQQAAATSLFDGKSLGDWKKTAFGGEGDVEVNDGRIMKSLRLQIGSPSQGDGR